MSKIHSRKIAHLLCSPLLGMVAFIISGIPASIVTARLYFPYSILFMIIAGGLGGLLLALFLQMRQKIGRMVLAGIVAWPVALFAGFNLGDFIIELYASFHDFYPTAGFGDGFCDILAGLIFGAVFGAIVFGRKSILLFSVVCGTVSIPFGLIDTAIQSGDWIKAWLEHFFEFLGEINIYLIMFNLSFGIGAGLSIGIYKLLIKRNDDGVFINKT